MSTPGVPPWGHPWHGLVEAGAMLLPNDTLRAYPQPEAKTDVISGTTTPIPDTYGSTYRVAVPGTPAVERTPEEQAADTAAGREWRNEATLSGGRMQLYGKRLDGWIYVDPAGARWLVRCAQLDENVLYSTAEPLELTVTLSRFGDLGGAPEQYSYPVSITSWGLDAGYTPTQVRLMVDDVRADGARAALMAHLRDFNNTSVRDVRRGMAWLELQLNGEGAAAIVAIATLRSQAQVFQVVRDAIDAPEYRAGWLRDYGTGSGAWEELVLAGGFDNGDPPSSPEEDLKDYSTEPPTTLKSWRMQSAGVFSGAVQFSFRRVVAVWYASAGSAEDLTQVVSWSTDIDWPLPAAGSRATSSAVQWQVRLEHQGAALSTIAGSTLTATTEFYPAEGDRTQEVRQTLTVDGVSSETVGDGPMLYGRWLAASVPSGHLGRPLNLLIEDVAIGNGPAWDFGVLLFRYANHVIGQFVFRPGGGVAFHPPATPSGVAAGVPYVPSPTSYSARYGSWCPYTHQSTWRSLTPVCYV